MHAVLGWSEHCIATHPSDFCVPLVALDAVVEIEGRAGRREIALEDLHRLPGDTPERETALEPGELIVALRLPAEAAGFARHARYLKVRERTSFAFAVVSAAAALRLDGGVIREARLALGGVAPKPWRAREAEAVLEGAGADEAAFRRAAEAALAGARPSGDNAFKIELARRIVVARADARRGGDAGAHAGLPASPFSSVTGAHQMPEINPVQASPHLRYGSNAGQPLTRRDGVLKVTGPRTYAADNHPDGMLYAVHAVSTIARGRVTHLDVAAAKAHPGVVEVITPANRPPLMHDPEAKLGLFGFRIEVLQNDRVRYANQPIALVVAETLEAATEGAALLRPRYEAEPARIGLDHEGHATETVGFGIAGCCRARRRRGGACRRGAAGRGGATRRPPQYHNAMEPHAVVAAWDGDRLTLDMPNQAPAIGCAGYATFFGIPPENVLIRTPFIGGGFGSKAILNGPQVLCILAARMLSRPVKLVLTRAQMFGPVGHRGATRQRLRLGMSGDGKLTALSHQVIGATSSFDDFIEPAAGVSRVIYASPAIAIDACGRAQRHRHAGADAGARRGLGLGCAGVAIDEAADACGMDPLDFRLKNYAEVEPITGKPFSSKALRECYAEGAKRFGWAGRPLAPRQMRDEAGFLVGWGMGTALFHAPMFAAEARATLRRDGTALVETSAIDMGQGAWTALAQIAADSLGLDIDQIEFRAGSSDLPDAGVAGGSGHTATAGVAIDAAGGDVITRLAEIATADRASPLYGAGNAGVVARDGRLHRRDDETRSESYAGHPCARRARRGQRQRQGRPRPVGAGLRDAFARRGLRRGEGRSRSRAGARHAPGRRLRRRPDHQPAACREVRSTAA